MRLLHQLDQHLRQRPRDPLPAPLVDELLHALAKVHHGCSLECAFGYDRRRRDSALRRAAELAAPDGSPWTQAGVLLAAAAAFERHRGPPRTEAEHALAVAAEAAPIPASRRQIARILEG